MSISPKAQHDKIALKIMARRARKKNNDKPVVEDTDDNVESKYTLESIKDLKKKDLKAIIDETEGVTYEKDDKLDALVAIVLDISK